MTKLPSALENIKNHVDHNNERIGLVLLDLKKQLEIHEWGINEFPGYILKFIQGQIQMTKGISSPHKHRYHYHLIQRGEYCYMTTSPQLLNTPGEMKVDYIKNHVLLTSVADTTEHITLIKEQLK